MSDTSMFTMDNASEVLTMALPAAKAHLESIIDKSNANQRNRFKAKQAVSTAKNVLQLSTMVANFILAHPENGRMTVI